MKKIADAISKDCSVRNIEENIVPVSEIFRLQGEDELKEAEKQYLPVTKQHTKAVILAASRGRELGKITEETPKAMVCISGKPVLKHLLEEFERSGVRDTTIVRGFAAEKISFPGPRYVENPRHDSTSELYSLYLAREALTGTALISYGDIVVKNYIITDLLASEGADILLVVDASSERTGQKDFVHADTPYTRYSLNNEAQLVEIGRSIAPGLINGEWTGMMRLSDKGCRIFCEEMKTLDEDVIKETSLVSFLEGLTKVCPIHVRYINEGWVNVNTLEDIYRAQNLK